MYDELWQSYLQAKSAEAEAKMEARRAMAKKIGLGRKPGMTRGGNEGGTAKRGRKAAAPAASEE